MGIPFSYYLNDLDEQGKGYRGCPYHWGFGNRDAHVTVTPGDREYERIPGMILQL